MLVDMASKGVASHFWRTLAAPGQSPLEVGRARALRDDGAFSWRHGFVAEVGGEVAAALMGYVIADPVDLTGLDAMSPTARALTVLEARAPGTWYVNVLAAYPEHRGRGLGSALLALADELGVAAKTRGMAIIVASQNAGARRLYERFGYRFAAKQPVEATAGLQIAGDWLLLVKPLG
jgi:ribosomal protein S18 acetylase RimI-like enzyme